MMGTSEVSSTRYYFQDYFLSVIRITQTPQVVTSLKKNLEFPIYLLQLALSKVYAELSC